MATDASGTAIGTVLSQDVEGEEKVIAYWSRQLNKAERNYSTTEREALAAVAAIKEEFFPYFYLWQTVHVADGPQPTNITKGTERYWREAYTLASLPSIRHLYRYRSGRNNANADALSRRPSSTLKRTSHVMSAV